MIIGTCSRNDHTAMFQLTIITITITMDTLKQNDHGRDLSAHLPFGSYAEQGMHTKAPSRFFTLFINTTCLFIINQIMPMLEIFVLVKSLQGRGWVKIQMTANASHMTAAVQRVTLLLGQRMQSIFWDKVRYSALQDRHLSPLYLARQNQLFVSKC